MCLNLSCYIKFLSDDESLISKIMILIGPSNSNTLKVVHFQMEYLAQKILNLFESFRTY